MTGPYLLLPLLVLLGSCQESGTPREDAQPEVPEAALFIVDSVPVATIGLDPPSEEYVFVDITGGGIVGDSLIVVVDSRQMRAGVYGFDGDFRRWIIREGEGPGEVESIHDSESLATGGSGYTTSPGCGSSRRRSMARWFQRPTSPTPIRWTS